MIKAQRGTADVLPKDSFKWQYVEGVARKVAKTFNVQEVRTPTFEATELFSRSSGETSDIVSKEMYTFVDKGNRSITLKPEGTAGVVRCAIENSLLTDSLPCKLFYLSPNFRYEKPQAGRLREFHQFGIEIFGSEEVKSDVEAILIANYFFNQVGIKDVVTKINSLGCADCRKKYSEALRVYLKDNLSNMCEDCNNRYKTNLLRILDCKVPCCREINKKAPKITDYLCEDCKNQLNNLTKALDENNIKYEIDSQMVRGLDYYTKTVFEFQTKDIDGASSIIGAGGRYDNLVQNLGGNSVPAVGFAIGLERIILLLDILNVNIPNANVVDAFIIKAGEIDNKIEYQILEDLRKNNLIADSDCMNRSFRANFKYANKIGAKNVIILGEEELKNEQVTIKNMNNGEENKVKFSEIVNYIKKA